MANHVYVVDDERDFLDSVQRGLTAAHIGTVTLETDPVRAAGYFRGGGSADVALIDVTMPGMSGLDLLGLIKEVSPATECLMLTAVDDARTAIACMKQGAYDYLIKPVTRDALVGSVRRALERKHLVEIVDMGKQTVLPCLKNQPAFAAFITGTPLLRRLLKEAELHAASDVPMLITGETGTGKEILARAIHRASGRSRGVFTPVNMAALSSTLFDAEFFGHTRGAFTGAEKDRVGYLEHTAGGSVFLDEIGTLGPDLQAKLLRVLQEQEFYKIGSSTPRKSDVRFIAATNANLDGLLRDGRFRKDLYYRLKGAWLHLPPLRERRADIPLLVRAFLHEMRPGGDVPAFEDEALEMLMAYSFPGNIRELKSIVHAAANLAANGTITAANLPVYLRSQCRRRPPATTLPGAGSVAPLAEVEKTHILQAYAVARENKTRTADLLGIGLNTLRRKLKSYGIQ